jgi:hypothetical protein|tara:strand:+ start:8628 stop:9251 length:624 start_codon:yes stop_codon:yes gene_type:complete
MKLTRPIIKELSLEAYNDTSILNSVAANLDNMDFKKVKTKYAKGGWDALSLHGYGNHPLDILKPGVLKSSVNIDTKLQWTTLSVITTMKPILGMLKKLPCEFERVRFMRLEAGKVIGKHTDKIDKDIGFDDGDIIRIHMPIRTNDNVVFTLYENTKDKNGTEHKLKTGHYYYTDVTKAHAVRNTSDIDRIHLVADCYSNEKMRALLS